MTRFSTYTLAFLIPVALWAQPQTGTIRLRDGNEITGAVVSANERDLTIRDSNGVVRRFRFDQMESIVFNGPRESFYRNDRPDAGVRQENAYPAAQAYREDMTLQPGTEVSVRTDVRIDSDSNEARSYPAQVERDIMDVNGDVLIPRGAEAQLVVRTLGRDSLALDLESITVNGRRYLVDADDVTRSGSQGIGANRRTGAVVGGGAVLGTLLGAIAGGGRGAAIGALAGGAAGAGVVVLTKGARVHVPAETVLNFRLDSPVNLNSRR